MTVLVGREDHPALSPGPRRDARLEVLAAIDRFLSEQIVVEDDLRLWNDVVGEVELIEQFAELLWKSGGSPAPGYGIHIGSVAGDPYSSRGLTHEQADFLSRIYSVLEGMARVGESDSEDPSWRELISAAICGRVEQIWARRIAERAAALTEAVAMPSFGAEVQDG